MKDIYSVESNTYKWCNSASVPTRTMWCFSATESLVPENFNYYQEPFKEIFGIFGQIIFVASLQYWYES